MKMYSLLLLVKDFTSCFRFFQDALGMEPDFRHEQ